ncbi:MAG: DNA gyrase inhibitor YacG [Pseudomonadota bacterium]|nr:DNA gyrase inhibitor YacG [Pseudomonadota bacterium]
MGKKIKLRCPICDAERVDKFRPFCSKRCAEIDLGRWFTGSYAVPTEEISDDLEFGFVDDEAEE